MHIAISSERFNEEESLTVLFAMCIVAGRWQCIWIAHHHRWSGQTVAQSMMSTAGPRAKDLMNGLL